MMTMVRHCLSKSEEARNSDDKLYECLLFMYGYDISKGKIVKFINSMTRARRKTQMIGEHLGRPEVMKKRQIYSTYRKEKYKATKKDIEIISINQVLSSK